MAANNTTVSHDFTYASISLYFCQKPPYLIWELTNTTLPWILDVVIFTAAPVTTVLNILVVVALNKSRELQKLSNILLCSMAVTDLITGAITMPMSAIVDVLMLTRVSVVHVCTFDSSVNKPLLHTMSIIYLSNYNCMGEIHGRKMLEELQEQSNQTSPSKTRGHCLAVANPQTGSNRCDDHRWCRPNSSPSTACIWKHSGYG